MLANPSRRPHRLLLVAGALAVSLLSAGAASYDFEHVGKDDRLPSIADCRDLQMKDTADCTGVVLPKTIAEPVTVVPGFSIVEQSAS